MTDFANRTQSFLTRKVDSKGEHLRDTCKLTDWANFTKKIQNFKFDVNSQAAPKSANFQHFMIENKPLINRWLQYFLVLSFFR